MRFQEYITEQQNTHMTHIEDKVLYGGVNGTRQAIMALRSLRDMLGGEKDGSVSVKWDGAPAIFAGTDPRDGRFFVAKKGIFNKSPKVYKSDADVDADASGDLAVKLKLALKHLPSLGIKGVIQGDFLFSSDDIKTQKIKGESYVPFTQIRYCMLSQQILRWPNKSSHQRSESYGTPHIQEIRSRR